MSRNEDTSEKGGKEGTTAVTRIDSNDSEQIAPVDESSGDAEPQGRWTRSLFRFGPLSGIFCMLFALATIIASLGILAGSDGRNIENWTTPPSTYLAIFTALANLSVRYAAVQGVIVAWWMRAMKGSTLSSLQYDWRAGSSLLGALTAGRNMGLLGLACLFSTLVVIDGPLLQRGSTVVRTTIAGRPLPLSVVMAPELPRGSTGYWIGLAESGLTRASSGNPEWNATVPIPHGKAPNDIVVAAWNAWRDRGLDPLWYNDLSLKDVVVGCPDKCRAKIRAPALFQTVNCTRQRVPLNYVEDWNIEKAIAKGTAPPLETYMFLISANLVLDVKEKVALNTGYTVVEDDARTLKRCNTTFLYDSCLYEAGIGEYDVHIQANEITMASLGPPSLVAMANNSEVDHKANNHTGVHLSTLGGAVAEIAYRWGSFVSAWKPPHGQDHAETSTTSFSVMEYLKDNTWCPAYSNPQADVVASMNKLMFYMGALAGKRMAEGHDLGNMDPGWPVRAVIDGHPEGEQDVFRTHYAFFTAAAMVELICVLLIAPTYWGWWRLGRHVSFSPLQIAKAFEAPLLSDCNSNGTDRKLAEATRDRHVKYGVMAAREGDTKLKIAFGDPNSQHIAQPQHGQRFGP